MFSLPSPPLPFSYPPLLSQSCAQSRGRLDGGLLIVSYFRRVSLNGKISQWEYSKKYMYMISNGTTYFYASTSEKNERGEDFSKYFMTANSTHVI